MRDAFFERLVEVARKDERVIVLSADHGAFALEKFQEEMPDRYINMGIAEQNMVGVAAGLAASGKIVFIYGITPFVSLRVLEQLTLGRDRRLARCAKYRGQLIHLCSAKNVLYLRIQIFQNLV